MKLLNVLAPVGLAAAALVANPVLAGGVPPDDDPFSIAAVAPLERSADTERTVKQLWNTRHSWAGEFASDIEFVHSTDDVIYVLVSDNVAGVHDALPADVRPHTTVIHGGVADAAGSPTSDRGGWTGGNHIYSTNGVGETTGCTQGFTWRSWATGAVLGSTALHCYQDDDSPFIEWYHDGRHLGTRTQAGTLNNDVVLLRPAPGTSFNASIWVHLPGGGVEERVVTGAGANALHTPIAFYGRTSGGGDGEITARNHPGAGEMTTDAIEVRPGDSGGPVYSTYRDGTVQARGTVSSLTYTDTNRNGEYDNGEPVTSMIFIDATYTSGNLDASIYVP
ncbi:hypothetical protein [Jiangella anatolica]|uniref:Peptidase S1 domain-containing protein n=1 Tax=Jiangella anatolica TaxID=2670374 RepID=A0A2W2C491_9ACTN|nr:hypothetical protein [Jiangella anatolica]PZF80566.1 hypothetical protein C1I92_25395 [Jiangella anatolica]